MTKTETSAKSAQVATAKASVKSGKAYTVNGGKDSSTTVKWDKKGKVGIAEITSSNTK